MNYIHHQDTVLDNQGRPVAGALVTVAGYPSGTAALFSDAEGTVSIDGTSTGTDGSYGFYAAPGRYTITISAAGIGTVTKEDVALNDATYTTDFVDVATFDSDWAQDSTAAFGTAAWKIDSSGVVRMRGKVLRASGSSSAGENLFTLPVGARPTRKQVLNPVGLSSGTYVAAPISVDTDGTVNILNASVTAVFLHGVSFVPTEIG